jgi:hypothetical protein
MAKIFRSPNPKAEKADALLPPERPTEGAPRGMRGAPPVGDWYTDPALKERPRGDDTDVSTGRTVDAHREGDHLSFSETPDLAADEVKAEASRHQKRRSSKRAPNEAEMRRGGPKSGI